MIYIFSVTKICMLKLYLFVRAHPLPALAREKIVKTSKIMFVWDTLYMSYLCGRADPLPELYNGNCIN